MSEYKPHPHKPRNVNHVHGESLTVNDKIALRVSGFVGTMWFCYGLAALMLLWALLQQTILPGLRIQAIDPYPFSFLFFCLGGIMQSLLMPMIMVEQNRQSRHAMQQSDAMYDTDIKTFHDAEVLIKQGNALHEEIDFLKEEITFLKNTLVAMSSEQLKHTDLLTQTPFTPRRRPMKQQEGKET